MKRFTETDKWKDVWFRELKGVEKLVFFYVIENCNNAGFYEEDMPMMMLQTGITAPHIEGAWKGLERGFKRASGWVWVRTFLKHQKNDELKHENPAHRQIIRLLMEQLDRFSGVPEFQDFIAPYKGLLRPTGKGIGTGNGTEESVRGTKRKGTQEEIIAYCRELGLPDSDGEWLYDKWEGTGWKNDGKPIASWQATARTWKRMGNILPSHKTGAVIKPSTNGVSYHNTSGL